MKLSKIIQHNSWGSFTAPKNERKCQFSFRPSTQYIDQIPPYDKWVDAMHVLGQGTPVKVKLLVGEARVHPDDEYKKKEGIQVAMTNAKEDLYDVNSITIRDDYSIHVDISSEDFSIALSIHKNSGPRLKGMIRRGKNVKRKCETCGCQ